MVAPRPGCQPQDKSAGCGRSAGRCALTIGATLLATADLKQEGEALRITATDVTNLDEAAATAGGCMRVWVRESGAVPHIRALLASQTGGRGRVVLVPRVHDAQQVEIALPGTYNVTPRLAQAMTVLPGVDRVEDV